MSNTIKNHLLYETFPVVLSVDIDGILLNYCDLQNIDAFNHALIVRKYSPQLTIDRKIVLVNK